MARGIYLLLLFLPLVDPRRANYPRFAGAYATIRLSITVLLAAFYAMLQLVARGVPLDPTRFVLVLVGGMFVLIGVVLIAAGLVVVASLTGMIVYSY